MSSLVFDDERGYADFATFVGRARALDAEGAMRLQAVGVTLAVHVQALPGRGLLAEGGVTGMRAMALGVAADLDVVVPLSALADRLAHHPEGVELAVPPMTVPAPWAALAPPRSGWEPVGEIDDAELERAARAGIEEVALGSAGQDGAPLGGAPALAALRQGVWGRLTTTTPPVPAGAAFAAYVLGFLAPQGRSQVLTRGRWVRVAASHG
ncbi:MAG: hypothetical protein ABI890_13060, partial [Lapillicoccus sp.]